MAIEKVGRMCSRGEIEVVKPAECTGNGPCPGSLGDTATVSLRLR